MHRILDLSDELLTPPIEQDGAKKYNPFFSPADIHPLQDINVHSSSRLSKMDQEDLSTMDKWSLVNDQQQTEDFLSSFDLTELNPLYPSGIPFDDLVDSSTDIPMSSFDERSMLLPTALNVNEPEDPSTLPWVAEECTIDDDVNDSLASPISISSTSTRRSGKKASLSSPERKLRKKDQNKTAAEKYRLKKRKEREELLNRQTILKNQNRQLKLELDSYKFRLEHLRQLLVDTFQIQPPASSTIE